MGTVSKPDAAELLRRIRAKKEAATEAGSHVLCQSCQSWEDRFVDPTVDCRAFCDFGVKPVLVTATDGGGEQSWYCEWWTQDHKKRDCGARECERSAEEREK